MWHDPLVSRTDCSQSRHGDTDQLDGQPEVSPTVSDFSVIFVFGFWIIVIWLIYPPFGPPLLLLLLLLVGTIHHLTGNGFGFTELLEFFKNSGESLRPPKIEDAKNVESPDLGNTWRDQTSWVSERTEKPTVNNEERFVSAGRDQHPESPQSLNEPGSNETKQFHDAVQSSRASQGCLVSPKSVTAVSDTDCKQTHYVCYFDKESRHRREHGSVEDRNLRTSACIRNSVTFDLKSTTNMDKPTIGSVDPKEESMKMSVEGAEVSTDGMYRFPEAQFFRGKDEIEDLLNFSCSGQNYGNSGSRTAGDHLPLLWRQTFGVSGLDFFENSGRSLAPVLIGPSIVPSSMENGNSPVALEYKRPTGRFEEIELNANPLAEGGLGEWPLIWLKGEKVIDPSLRCSNSVPNVLGGEEWISRFKKDMLLLCETIEKEVLSKLAQVDRIDEVLSTTFKQTGCQYVVQREYESTLRVESDRVFALSDSQLPEMMSRLPSAEQLKNTIVVRQKLEKMLRLPAECQSCEELGSAASRKNYVIQRIRRWVAQGLSRSYQASFKSAACMPSDSLILSHIIKCALLDQLGDTVYSWFEPREEWGSNVPRHLSSNQTIMLRRICLQEKTRMKENGVVNINSQGTPWKLDKQILMAKSPNSCCCFVEFELVDHRKRTIRLPSGDANVPGGYVMLLHYLRRLRNGQGLEQQLKDGFKAIGKMGLT